ncbi:MAG: EscC/YscC/HrcC family type III secretion system outer membrane ring protein, partial [Mailhella sp.]|nr:EscC/YscC/HrcC family type III secretion system outer membrane ring protein [Mailhella sp.]
MNWYVLARTIFFYNTAETQRIFLTPRAGNVTQLYETLKQSGVFSPQLPGRLSGTGDVITVSGPPEYLQQIRSAVSAFEASQMDQMVMRVFPLKYAWADDQTVTSMDKTVTIPGVAAILRAMVLGGSGTATRVVQQKATVEKLGGKG